LPRALLVYDAVSPLINAPRESSLGRLMSVRPETIGAVIWPYQCSGWDGRTRLVRIQEHYSIAEQMGGLLNLLPEDSITLIGLPDIRDGLRVVLDQPKWFLREGQLAINLFVEDDRIYTLAFSLFRRDGDIAAFVGSIQGRDIEDIQKLYRELTKACDGIHPRDLLIKIFQMFCAVVGIEAIFAVADAFRNQRDTKYFGQAPANKFHTNYDTIWREKGGTLVDPMFYHLDVGNQERDLDAMSSTKRKKYRKRVSLLRSIEAALHEAIKKLNGRAASAKGL
jgi:uncharacterized protein VirK/YbjX